MSLRDDTVHTSDSAEFRPEWTSTGHLAEESIYAWLDGAFDLPDNAAIEQHVQACKDCSAAVAEARGFIAGAARIVGALDAVPQNIVPHGDVQNTAARIVALADANVGSRPPAPVASGPKHDGKHDARRTSNLDAKARPWYSRAAFRTAAAVVVMAGGATYVVNATHGDARRASAGKSLMTGEPNLTPAPAPPKPVTTGSPEAAGVSAAGFSPAARSVVDSVDGNASSPPAALPQPDTRRRSPDASLPQGKAEKTAVAELSDKPSNPQARSLADGSEAKPKLLFARDRGAGTVADTSPASSRAIAGAGISSRNARSLNTPTVPLPLAAAVSADVASAAAKAPAPAAPTALPSPTVRADSSVVRDALNVAPKDVAEREKRDALAQMKKTTITGAVSPMQTTRQDAPAAQSSATGATALRARAVSRPVTFIGMVTDGRKAVFAATVSVDGKIVKTDSTGRFTIRGVIADTLSATVQASAFITQIRKLDVTKQDTIRMDFVLVRSRP